MKELKLIKERVAQVGHLLPWWVCLIPAELSLVILYLLDIGALAQIIIPGIFVGISMISEHANERNKLESKQIQGGKINYENMPVTKVIVKDLLKGTYREIYHKPRNWGPKKEDERKPEKMSKAIIIGIGAISTLLITFIVLKIGFSFYEKETALVSEQNNEQQPVSMIPIQQPQQWERNQKDYKLKSVSQQKHKNNYKTTRIKYSGNIERKEKIYRWVENGVNHYTNLQSVAIEKNAVEVR